MPNLDWGLGGDVRRGGAWAAINGASLKDSFKAGLMAAGMAAVTFGIGGLFGDTAALWGQGGMNWTEVARAASHGLSGGVFSEMQGGSFGSGFAAGFVGSLAGSAMKVQGANNYFGGEGAAAIAKRTVAAAVVGGTVSEIGGGKFGNGAMTAAIQHLFNQEYHEGESEWEREQRERRQSSKAKIVVMIQENRADDPVGHGSNQEWEVRDRVTLHMKSLGGNYDIIVDTYDSLDTLTAKLSTYTNVSGVVTDSHGLFDGAGWTGAVEAKGSFHKGYTNAASVDQVEAAVVRGSGGDVKFRSVHCNNESKSTLFTAVGAVKSMSKELEWKEKQ